MNIAIIVGTRPEIIKMAPIIRFCEQENKSYFILHTGQHYDYEMDKTFFDELELPLPKYNLEVGGLSYAEQMGKMIAGMTRIFKDELPQAIIVQGDTNSVLAASLVANKLGVTLVHHEAGLRSGDLSMPEEKNRILTDHISDVLFTPTNNATKQLNIEGIDNKKTFCSGNTIVDAVEQHKGLALKKSQILDQLGIKPKEYILCTVHRSENIMDEERLEGIVNGLSLVQKQTGLPIIIPMHPHTKNKLKLFGLSLPEGIIELEPLGYLDFLCLEMNARAVLTDSGGIQEEACILQVPCVTIRNNTERPETLKGNMNIIAGVYPKSIVQAVIDITEGQKKIEWSNPFGDGKSAKMIIEKLEKVL
ncbi:UDP-N-acetylglucosamine 2-epimerase (non-hydrolyzing) [Patescibacteria group bacterium]|nr:UDP-N-acetylglucosamine 2-epimerase (non-hydrolyzing) [Patescibacteria group bacterium]MBU1722093.1 UDP-N-acetylglucosamine 2-epimerase (non-hydrolyzing) [Patescibacteria group bacterium]